MNQLKNNISITTALSLFSIIVFVSFITFCKQSPYEQRILTEVQKILPEIKTYDYGQSREPLTKLSGLVKESLKSSELKAQVETEMVLFLNSDATFAGKQHVCEELSIIGTKEAVHVLIKMLSDEKYTDIVLYALLRIPGPEADNALVNALTNTEGKTKIGIINTLGQRKSKNAVGELGKLIFDTDIQIAGSAVSALGKIADINAYETLEIARSKTSGKLNEMILDCCLRCADNFFNQGNISKAASIYREIYESKETVNIRTAALLGLMRTEKEGVIDIILSVFKKENSELQSAAINYIRELPENMNLKKIVDYLPNLPDKGQVQLISAFADRRETSAHRNVLNAVKHKNQSVRIAALKSLAKIGNESDIDLLLKTAAGKNKAESEAAGESLALLKGESVDRKIVSKISGANVKIKAELVRCIGERNIVSAVPTILETAVDPDRTIRRESFKALSLLAGPDYINDVITLLIKEENGVVRKEAERSLVTIAKKIPDGRNKAESILNVLPSVEKSEAKSSLLQVLGRIGDKNALSVLRENLKSKNSVYQEAAIHAFSAWPDAEPVHDLMDAIKTTGNKTNKILALRTYINLLSIDNNRTEKETIDLYLAAMEQAVELNEKRMVLSGLANLRSMEALEAVSKYLDVKEIQPEAEVAVERLSGRIREGDNNRIKEILNKVQTITKNSELRERIKNRLKSMK